MPKNSITTSKHHYDIAMAAIQAIEKLVNCDSREERMNELAKVMIPTDILLQQALNELQDYYLGPDFNSGNAKVIKLYK